MDKKTKEVYGNKPKLDRRTKRKIKREIDKDIKAGKYDDLKAAIKQEEDKAKGGLNTGGSKYNG
jgi:hypothetical protein